MNSDAALRHSHGLGRQAAGGLHRGHCSTSGSFRETVGEEVASAHALQLWTAAPATKITLENRRGTG